MDRERDGAERDADELLYCDLHDNAAVFPLEGPTIGLDHCDLLLDALDAQLVQLQVRPQKHEAVFRKLDCSDSAPLQRSQSLSKDTGLGSTTNDTPMSCLELIHTPTTEHTSERSAGCWEDPVAHGETKPKSDGRTREKEEVESQREQVIWRLERLLGESCDEGRVAVETEPTSDSICTEDFVRRFRDEMVEMAAVADCSVQQLDSRQEAERTEISERDPDQRTALKTSAGPKTVDCSRSKEPRGRGEPEECLSDSYGENASESEKAGVRGRYGTPQRTGGLDGKNVCSSSSGTQPFVMSQRPLIPPPGQGQHPQPVCPRTKVVVEDETPGQKTNPLPKARSLAGVPVRSFDSVSIDSDLDSVRTDQVRRHIHRRSGWRSLIQSVKDLDGYYDNQSDCDTPTVEDSEPPSTSGGSTLCGAAKNRSHSPFKAKRNKRETCRHLGSLDDKDTDEEVCRRSRRCRPERTLEKMQSDWFRMKDHLSALRQKCEKEEERLRLKKTQIRDAELSLSELQHRRQHALQELEQIVAEREKIGKESMTLAFYLKEGWTGKDSASFQQHKLCKQDSCIVEPGVVMSVLERDEMDRQLNNAKMELFAEQRRARERMESVQERFEETCEELRRATEAESLLRSRCSSLEEEQRQDKDQMKAVKAEVGKLQAELGECTARRGALERMLAQKELQLLDLQEKHGALQAERDRMKEELNYVKAQHRSAVKDAKEQSHRVKLKEEEITKLQDSLERQEQEVKSREEELNAAASEKVKDAVEEERRKWEAEKVEEVQEQLGILEERNRRIVDGMRREMQQEKSRALDLQDNVLQLKTRLQELQRDSCAQQREQESVLAVVCKSLKEEHQAELQKMQKQMTQERQKVALQLQQEVQLAVREADILRVTLEEKERSHDQTTGETEQHLRHWARELGVECQRLRLLVEQRGAKQGSEVSAPSLTVPEALTHLRALREQLNDAMSRLHQELHSQRQTAEQLRDNKEQELIIQKQQLSMERDEALKTLKERLIQEHIEELSSLTLAHLCHGGAEGGGGVAASLRKQLKAKDAELRQVQRRMDEWKEQTAARLACKFEEELTAELERKSVKTQDRLVKSLCPNAEMTRSPKDSQMSVSSAPQQDAAPCGPSDVASLKLLRYLQERVKQLRVENNACSWGLSPAHTVPGDLSGSYLTTTPAGQDLAGIQSHSSVEGLKLRT